MKKTIIFAGPAGGGLNSLELLVENALHKRGLHTYSYKNYMSRVRGGFNILSVTFSEEPVLTYEPKGDYYVALDAKAVQEKDLWTKPEGKMLVSSKLYQGNDALVFDQAEIDKIFKHANAFGTAAVGFLLASMGFQEESLKLVTKDKWSEEVNQGNLGVAKLGWKLANDFISLPETKELGPKISGNQAIALGALAGGLGFMCAYPMAPSTGILNYVTANEKKMHVFTEQAEDELSAVLSTIGAASMGVKAMTASSGGGFALMTEAIGLAGIAEIPLLVTNVQRPGPATGLPTRTEQGDFLQALGASQGEFPKVIMAPASVEDCLYTANRALDLAWKYRVPVILLSDQYLADSSVDIPPINYHKLVCRDHFGQDSTQKIYSSEAMTDSFRYPGQSESTVLFDSHIHEEDGFYTEDDKLTDDYKARIKTKLSLISRELRSPEYFGSEDPEIVFVSWGSNRDIILETMKCLDKPSALLHLTDLFPLNADALDRIRDNKIIINVECNAFNQVGHYLRAVTGVMFTDSINRYDGRPLSVDFMLRTLKEKAYV